MIRYCRILRRKVAALLGEFPRVETKVHVHGHVSVSGWTGVPKELWLGLMLRL